MNSLGESDDDNKSEGQMGKKVDSNEVKCLKESVKHKDQKWDELVDENKRLKLELRKVLSSNRRGAKGDIRKDNDWNGEEVNFQTRWSYGSRQLDVAGSSLDVIKPNPIHGRVLVLV